MLATEDRIASIQALVAASTGRRIIVAGSTGQKAVLADLPESLLLYRKENGRLLAELIEGSDLGGRPEEDPVTQRALETLLLAASKDKAGNIYDELKRVGAQTEPLLITASGVVLNGNRRLAAMRDLLKAEPQRMGGFGVVSCAALPSSLTPEELEVIEASLQMAPETKLSYGWVSRRLKLRRQRQHLKMSVDEIVEASRLTSPAELTREIEQLELVEDYLNTYMLKPKSYSLVGDCKPLFVGLHSRLEALPDDLRGVWKNLGFVMIAGRNAVKGALASQFPFADPIPDHLPSLALRKIAEELELIEPGAEEERLSNAALQDLGVMASDTSKADDLAPRLFSTIERTRTEFLEQHTPVRMVRLIKKARETLVRMNAEAMTDKSRSALRAEIRALTKQVSTFLGDDNDGESRGLFGLRRRT